MGAVCQLDHPHLKAKQQDSSSIKYLDGSLEGQLLLRSSLGDHCRTNVKAGLIGLLRPNHNQVSASLKVRSQVKAGALNSNHNQVAAGLKIRSKVKAGALANNHNQVSANLKIRSNIKAGLIGLL